MTLSRTESSILRALAIIGIFLHNYCHFMPWAVKENEYTFSPDKPAAMLHKIEALDSNLLVHLFSFFGHYGVPVFLFLSGYGLVMKYERNTKERISFGTFARYNYTKLLRLMLPAFILFVALWVWQHGTPGLQFYSPAKIVGHITMTINLWEHPSSVIKPGPYWYFGLTMQLYLLFHIAFYRRPTRWLLTAVALCLLLQLLCLGDRNILKWYRYNFMGSLLPFALGMLMARYGEAAGERCRSALHRSSRFQRDAPLSRFLLPLFSFLLSVVSFLLVFLMSFNPIAWTFAPAFVCTGMVALIKSLPGTPSDSKGAGAVISRIFTFVGTISAAIFVIHPHLRELIIPISKSGDTYTGLLLYIAATLVAATLYHYIQKYLHKRECKK